MNFFFKSMTPRLNLSIISLAALLLAAGGLAAAPAMGAERPEFWGAWVVEKAPGSEEGSVYRVTQDGASIRFQRGIDGPVTRYPSDSPATSEPGRSWPTASRNAAAFVPDDVRVSPPGRALIDPEFNDGQQRVTYWDRAGGELAVGVAELDPQTGLLKSETGRDFLVDTGVSPAFKEGRWWSHNGPEWGRDRNGWAIYYTKQDEEGNRQMWRAVEKGGRHVPEQLTTRPSVRRRGPLSN